MSSPRIIALDGAYNVRDIGGYATIDGRNVRHGLVFRSASLDHLTDDGIAALEALGVESVIDMRSTAERAHRSSRVRGEVWARDYDVSGADLVRKLCNADATADTAASLMVATYQGIHEEQADAFAELFRRIAAGELPLLFHCAVGKDRTGAAAALLLTLLGVAPEAILADYLFTRHSVARSHADARAALASAGAVVQDEVLAPIIGVDEAYLATMFASINATYGSVIEYAARVLAVDDERLKAIRTRLLK